MGRSWSGLFFRGQEAREDGGGLLPVVRFLFHLFAAGARQAVVLGAAIVFRRAPLGSDVALLFELQQRGVERAVVNEQAVAAGLLDAAGDAVAVERAEKLDGFQDHEGQGALPDVGFVAHATSYGLAIEKVSCVLWGR